MALSRTIQAAIWAGSDLYEVVVLVLPVIAHISKRAYLHNQVIRQIQPRVNEDFGIGSKVVQVDNCTYRIDVSDVYPFGYSQGSHQ